MQDLGSKKYPLSPSARHRALPKSYFLIPTFPRNVNRTSEPGLTANEFVVRKRDEEHALRVPPLYGTLGVVAAHGTVIPEGPEHNRSDPPFSCR